MDRERVLSRRGFHGGEDRRGAVCLAADKASDQKTHFYPSLSLLVLIVRSRVGAS